MKAGTIGLLEGTADGPLEDYHDGGFTTVDVRDVQTYLDGATVQMGRMAATVEQDHEDVHVAGGSIEVDSATTNEQVWTPWVGDVEDAGFVVAERTASGDPPFPFGVVWGQTGRRVAPAEVDVAAFVQNQNSDDRDWNAWMVGRKHDEHEEAADDTAINYGKNALRKDAIQAEIGVGFRTPWRGTMVKGVLYGGGYVAIYEPSAWGSVQFARFIRQEILPVASVPEPDATGEQTTLGEGAAD